MDAPGRRLQRRSGRPFRRGRFGTERATADRICVELCTRGSKQSRARCAGRTSAARSDADRQDTRRSHGGSPTTWRITPGAYAHELPAKGARGRAVRISPPGEFLFGSDPLRPRPADHGGRCLRSERHRHAQLRHLSGRAHESGSRFPLKPVECADRKRPTDAVNGAAPSPSKPQATTEGQAARLRRRRDFWNEMPEARQRARSARV
jgi:hypothetical protein